MIKRSHLVGFLKQKRSRCGGVRLGLGRFPLMGFPKQKRSRHGGAQPCLWRLFTGLAALFLVCAASLPLVSCGEPGSTGRDPFAAVRGDFDAEITWTLTPADNGATENREATVYTAGVSSRGGLLSMTFSSPESMKDIRVEQTEGGSVRIRRGELVLSGTAYAPLLDAARLLTETGAISDRTVTADGSSLTYLVTLPDGTRRTRTMSCDGAGNPLFVTDPGYTTVKVVWFERRGEK